MRVRLLTTATHAGGVSRHVSELAAGLRGLGCEVGMHPGPADIFHIHLHDTYDRRAFALALGARFRGAPVILTEHLPRTNASDPALLPGPRRRGASLAKAGFKRAEATLARKIVTVCEGSRDFLQKRYGIDGAQVHTIHNGVPPHRDSGGPTPNGRLRIVAIGTLNAQKGHDVLIAAAARSRGEWRATIIGTGSARNALDRMAGELGRPQVSLVGWRDDARDASLEADVLCLPSRWEACPYVVLDAMARARCVVATHVDGLPEIVEHGVSGMLVPPDDASELARVLDWLAANPQEVRRMGLAGRERVEEHFGLDRMITATHDLYRETLNA